MPSLSGVVYDRSTDAPLEGARIMVVELGRRSRTDGLGRFEFQNMPRGDFTLGIHFPGYRAEHLLVSVPGVGEIRVALAPGYQFHEEITVSATPWADEPLRIPQQIEIIGTDRIELSSDGSVARLVGRIPGVRTAYTGDSTAKPVIRGLTGNRIRLLNDGFPTNYQQFGIRHPPNVEALGTERVEVVRGPASVLFGADAMGGVVNLIQPPLPSTEVGESEMRGEIYGAFAGNTNGGTGYFRLEGAHGGFGWRGSFVRRSFGDVHTPSRVLEGTGFGQKNGDAAIGYTGARGAIRLRWHHWESDAGFFAPRGFRIGLEDDLIAADAFVPSAAGNIELAVGHQRNVRRAFPFELGGRPALHLDLSNTVLDARLHHRPLGILRGTVAAQFGAQENVPVLGTLLPKYRNRSWALSCFEQVGFKSGGLADRWLLSMALRYDHKDLKLPGRVDSSASESDRSDWSAATASAGVLYRVNEGLSVAGSLGGGWRAPSEFELFVRGVHGGVGAIQIGDPSLEEETNTNSELSVRWSVARTKGYVTFFNNAFENYIYLANTGEVERGLPVFDHRQADAYLRGVEASCMMVVAEWLRSSFGFEYLKTQNRVTGARLPLSPPTRVWWSGRVQDRRRGDLLGLYGELSLEWSAAGRISGPEEPFPFNTEAYATVDFGAGASVLLSENAVFGIDLLIHNLLNREYRDFLYTYKGVALMPGRDVRLVARIRF